MEVKKCPEIIDRDCNCQNWLKHWLKSQHKKARPECSVYNCTNEALVGGHVTLTEDPNSKALIVPLCLYHNTIREHRMTLIQEAVLVEPGFLDTCE